MDIILDYTSRYQEHDGSKHVSSVLGATLEISMSGLQSANVYSQPVILPQPSDVCHRCSLSCTNLHKAQCNDPLLQQPNGQIFDHHLPVATNGSLNTSTVHDPYEPFRTLKDSQDLSRLFERYPALRTQLNQLYQIAADPRMSQQPRQLHYRGRNPQGHFRERHDSRSDRWTPEQGFNNALHTLENELDSDMPKYQGLREYAKLVLRLNSSNQPTEDTSKDPG